MMTAGLRWDVESLASEVSRSSIFLEEICDWLRQHLAVGTCPFGHNGATLGWAGEQCVIDQALRGECISQQPNEIARSNPPNQILPKYCLEGLTAKLV
jgi:hypothetical protein